MAQCGELMAGTGRAGVFRRSVKGAWPPCNSPVRGRLGSNTGTLCFQITTTAGCSGFVTAKPSSAATRQSFWSAATKTVANPARLRPRATDSCKASSVRRASVTPYLKSSCLALRKCTSFTAATKRRPRPRSASRRRRAISAACWSISPVRVFNAKDGFHFHDCEARDQMLGIPLGLKPGDQVAAHLQAVKLGQCAGVKVISGQSALSPFFEDGLR